LKPLPNALAKRLIAPLLIAVLAATSTHAEPGPWPDASFDAHFRQVIDEAGIPGGAYAIVRDGRIIETAGHGVRQAGGHAPVTETTVFRIASVSKTFAAELTALLVRDGALRWDDTLGKALPGFRFKGEGQAQRLQIQHLLGQSTGIVPNAYDNMLDANQPLASILPHFRELEPNCLPGACYTYQNILFSLIEPVIERATRRSYAELVDERLFKPLRMQHASVGMAAFLAEQNRALPHVKRRGGWSPTEVQPGYYEVLPAAGVNASAADLGTWLLAQLGHFPEVVPPQVAQEITQARVRTARDLRRSRWRELISDAHYGLGWRIYRLGNEDLYLHSGWVKGYVAEIAYSRQRGTGLVVLLNAESGSALSEITAAFWKAEIRNERNIALGMR